MTQKKKLTKKEVKFAKEYARNGGNGTAAALVSYETKKRKRASTIASRTLKKPEVQATIKDELAKQNITVTRALAPIAKALTATKKDIDGSVVDDLDMQLKGSDRAIKLLLPDLRGVDSPSINTEVRSITINVKNYRK